MANFDVPESFWEHIDELRSTFIRVLLVITIGTALSLCFYKQVFDILTIPLQRLHEQKSTETVFKFDEIKKLRIENVGANASIYQLPPSQDFSGNSSAEVKQISDTAFLIPNGGYIELNQRDQRKKLVVLGPVDGIITTLKTSFWVGFVGTSPIWMYFILHFIAPALHISERKFIIPFLLSTLLFITLGFLFAYNITLPLANQYLNAFNQSLGVNLWTLSSYLDFTLILLLANALAFELCVILLFLIQYGVISSDGMAANRKLVIASIFILSAFLTPPDVLTQIMLAIPLTALYEIGILYARLRANSKRKV